jgi:trans-aconitate methyltransferase
VVLGMSPCSEVDWFVRMARFLASAIAESVALATKRATAAANIAVRFEEARLNTYEPSVDLDALIGRSVLPYLADPPGVLRRLASMSARVA